MDGKKIVSTAKQYIGYTGRKFCEDYGLPWGSDWCCAYVWDIFRIAGASSLFYGGQKTAYVPTATVWLQANCKHITMAKAKPGDIVVMTWSGKGYNKERGSRNHIGIIRKSGTQNVAYTIEGNTGSTDATKTKVMERERASRYIYGIYRPNYSNQYVIKFAGRKGEGKMKPLKVDVGETITLPANKFKREGFKFVGWGVDKPSSVNYKHLQIGKVKYKNKQEVKDLAKAGGVIILRACWKGYGAEAAAYWARKIAKDNTFTYGVDDHKDWYHGRDRAHQVGCYFCGTNITGVKKAKKGSRWDKTYCCNSFVMAALTHGANLFSKCGGGSTKPEYWTKLQVDGKPLYKIIGKNVKYSALKECDIMCNGKHVKIFTGVSKFKGLYLVSHAAGEGWGARSIRTDRVSGRIGKDYTALRYIGRGSVK